MKNFIQKTKYLSLVALALFLFIGTRPVSADCWTEYGPYWMNCNADDDSSDDDSDDDDDDDDDSDNLSVSTLSASSVDEDSATLRGEITDLDESEDYDRWFEWGTDEDDLDHTTSVSGTTDDEGDFSKSISNLSDDREYFFRACAESNDSNDEDCGSVRSFTTDEENDNNNNDDDDDNDNDSNNDDAIITTDATGVTAHSAILNGVVINDGGSQRVWFEYGSTTYLGNSTVSRNVSGGESLVSVELHGLTSSHAYFFRLVSEDGERGDIRSLVTKSATNPAPTPTTPTTPTPKPTPGVVIKSDQYLNVDLVGSMKEANAGDNMSYAVVYENLTNSTLRNIKIATDFPEGLTPTKSSAGTFASKQNIELAVPSLGPKSSGSFTIDVSVNRDVSEDEFLVSIIEATYDHPTTENTTISTVDYSILKIIEGGRDNDQSANALFALGVFPMNFWGWLLIVGLIILIIVFASKAYKKKDKGNDDHDHHDFEKKKTGLQIIKS